MGWRGVLRSAVAASRAAERNRQKREGVARRGHQQVDRIVERLDLEIDRSLNKIQKLEEKIHTNPLTASGLQYDPQSRRWTFKEISESTGQLKWKLKLEFISDAANIDGSVTDTGRTYELLAITATKWAVFAVFKVSVSSITPATKLFSKTAPIKNKVLLISNGTAYRALEGQLDIDVPVPGSMVALVAFPLPVQQAPDLCIDFLLKSGTARIKLTAESPTLFADAARSTSLVDAFRAKLKEKADPVHQQAGEAKARIDRAASSSGAWLGLLILVGIIVLVVVLVRS